MTTLTETATYDAGVTQLDTGVVITGGPTGSANAPLKNLANRTAYLKSHVDTLEAGGGTSSSTNALKSATTTIAVNTATAPTTGQVLTATSSTAATWQTPAGGSTVTMSDDTTTNATYYPTFATATSGTVASLKAASSKLTFNPSTGTLSATIVNSLSDSRYKTNIRPLGYGLSTVLTLTGYKYELVDSDQTSLGLIAQDVEKVVPEVVITDVDGKMGINYSAMIAVLVEAVKELNAKVATLEGK
jgi:hypothetical protein